MNRRTFLCGLTLGALAAPLTGEAQQAGEGVPDRCVGGRTDDVERGQHRRVSTRPQGIRVRRRAEPSDRVSFMSKLPAIYGLREFVEAGGLMSYGPDRRDMYRRAAIYVHRILSVTKPEDLPVEQPMSAVVRSTLFDLGAKRSRPNDQEEPIFTDAYRTVVRAYSQAVRQAQTALRAAEKDVRAVLKAIRGIQTATASPAGL
jgi:hypothetical protein